MLDAGATQLDPLAMDVTSTLTNYLCDIHSRHAELLEAEIAFLKNLCPDLVLSDATALACRAAKSVGINSALITNFTWENIYREMLLLPSATKERHGPKSAELQEMLSGIASDYCCATAYLQLPGEMSAPEGFTGRLIAAPLLCREPKRTRLEMRSRYGISDDSMVLVYGFGGQKRVVSVEGENSFCLRDDMLPPGWVCMVLMGDGLDFPSSRFIGLPQNLYVPDVLVAGDAFLGKLGYGTCSECLATNTPLIWVTRTDWPEEKPLQKLMERFDASIQMTSEDYLGGRWCDYLSAALAKRQRGLEIGMAARGLGIEGLRFGRDALGGIADTVLELAKKG